MMTSMKNATMLLALAALFTTTARAQEERALRLGIDGGFQPNEATWVLEAKASFALEASAPEAGSLMIVAQPLGVWGQLRPETATVVYASRINGRLRLDGLRFPPESVGTAWVLQAFMVSPAGAVYESEVINLYVTDDLAPEAEPKADPAKDGAADAR